MNFIKRNRAYLIAPAVVLLILSIIYIIKGVYPFGDRSVAYYDMPACYVPLYTHTYDFLHGDAPALLDWYNAASCDFTLNSITYILNPFNLLLYFTTRGNVINFMNIILMIKLASASFTMALYLRKKYRSGDLNTVILSLMYTFCGFTFNDYMNIFFLDLLILAPLIMLTLEHLIKTRKAIPYTIVTFIAMTLSFYLSAMAYMYVILYIFGYFIFIEKDRKARRRIAADVGIYTFIALLMSAGIMLPAVIKTANSPRTGYIQSFGEVLTTRTGSFDDQKLFMLFGCEFALSVLILAVIKCIKNRQKPDPRTRFDLYRMVLLIIPIISEGSDLLWHFGSYAHFPYRFGFILSFTSIDVLANFIDASKDENKYFQIKKPKLSRGAEYGAIAASISSCIIFAIIAYLLKDSALNDNTNYNNATIRTYRAVLPLMVLSGILIFGFCNKKMRSAVLAIAVVLQSSLGCFGFIAPETGYNACVIDAAASVYSDLDLEHDNISRVKCTDAEGMILNFPLLSGYAGLTDWTLNPSPEYMKEIDSLGYANSYTTCYDVGGSLFSDALLNVKMTYNRTLSENNDFYTFRQKAGDHYFYDCKYKLPFGILAENDISAIPQNDDSSPFELHNNIYRAISSDGDIFDYHSLSELNVTYNKDIIASLMLPFTYTFNVDVTGNALIYTYSANEDLTFSFLVNEDPKAFLDNRGSDHKNTDYISNGFSQTVELGTFKDETVKLSLFTNSDDIEDLYIGILDLDKLGELCEKYTSGDHAYDVRAEGTELSMKVDDPQGRWLFLPIEYSSNWKATINGEKADITPVMGDAFMGIRLGSEDAEIELKFVPELQYRCIILTFIGTLLLAAVLIMNKKGHRLSDVKIFNGTAIVVFTAAASGLIIVLYIAPIIGNIVSFFI